MTFTNTNSLKHPEHTYLDKYLFSQKHQDLACNRLFGERFAFKLVRSAFFSMHFSQNNKDPLVKINLR